MLESLPISAISSFTYFIYFLFNTDYSILAGLYTIACSQGSNCLRLLS